MECQDRFSELSIFNIKMDTASGPNKILKLIINNIKRKT